MAFQISGSRRSVVVMLGLLVLVGTTGVTAQERPEHDRILDATLLRQGIAAGRLRPDVIASWNSLAHDIAFAEDQFLTFKGQRALAMMHLAMHDALNAIVPVYETYAYAGGSRLAHPIAATAQAAYDVLLDQYPGQAAALSPQLARWLADVPSDALRARGIALGHAAAAAVLARRKGDGWDIPGAYEFGEGAGRYQTTPPWNGFVAQPGFRSAMPFVLEYPQQFRPSPPPPLRATAYARAFREVKDYGAVDSTRRTEDQTAYALWWMEFAEGSVNRLARRLVTGRNVHLWHAARVFAHIGTALYDTYVATWDAKYEYDHWRPHTAIRAAETDGNSRTTSDERWQPLRPTPPFPEYTSAHAAACAASFGVLEQAFGRRLSFTMETTTAPSGMATRRFDSFRAAAVECADSRVRLGWHFRYATDAGLVLGRQIARYAHRHSLRKGTWRASTERDDLR
jgi:PAP2 superfamily